MFFVPGAQPVGSVATGTQEKMASTTAGPASNPLALRHERLQGKITKPTSDKSEVVAYFPKVRSTAVSWMGQRLFGLSSVLSHRHTYSNPNNYRIDIFPLCYIMLYPGPRNSSKRVCRFDLPAALLWDHPRYVVQSGTGFLKSHLFEGELGFKTDNAPRIRQRRIKSWPNMGATVKVQRENTCLFLHVLQKDLVK